jgi:hypothetical protein
MNAATIIALIEQGVILIPKFVQLWSNIRGSFSASDMAAIDAALETAKTRDASDTAQADIDLDAASKL